jgi:phosphoribosyl 1,2-cyclic phosphodiesterase
MHYISLASGSKGNCHAFFEGQQILLIDAGISLKQIRTRLLAAGINPSQVGAVALSHEHFDHVSAVPVLLRNTDWLFITTMTTLAAIKSIYGIEIPSNRILNLRHGHITNWNGIKITPFAIPHDAVDPVAFRIDLAGFHAAIVTDLGHQTSLVMEYCNDLDLLVLEANHDVSMLKQGNYPPALKSRILSNIGHLSNESMGMLLTNILSTRLKTLVLAHLSAKNNDPTIARAVAEKILQHTTTTLYLAQQQEYVSVTNIKNLSTV